MTEMFSENKIILDLCGGTGAWSKPYKDAGYDVRLVTLPDNDVTEYIPPNNVYGILAAPPCTEFTNSKNGHPEIERDYIKGMIPVNSCCRMAWQCNPLFFALENPAGQLSRFLGKPGYYFDPWYFGDPWTKYTGLWGNFNKPKRLYYKIEDVLSWDEILKCKENRKPQDSGSSEEKAFKRAITPPGFAKAFFEANQ